MSHTVPICWFPKHQLAGWQLLLSLQVPIPSLLILLKGYPITEVVVGHACAQSHAGHCTLRSIAASVESLWQSWLQGPAFTTLEESRLDCRVGKAKLSFSTMKKQTRYPISEVGTTPIQQSIRWQPDRIANSWFSRVC